jgi:hypothetical protein
MNLKKVRCFFGIHDYRLRRKIFNNKQECVKSIYICKDCRKEIEYDYDREVEKANLNSLKIKNEKIL